MLQALFLGYAAAWALAAARIAGFVLVSPFPGENVSTTQRIGLVAVLGWIATLLPASASAPPELGTALATCAASELGCGLVIGMAFRLVFMAAEVAGQMVSQGIGLASASELNPTIGQQDTVLARVVTLVAMLLALGAGVHRVALAYLLGSFAALPIGHPIALGAAAIPLTNLAIESFTVGVRLAMPVTAVAFVVHLGLAMIARAAPALQIFNIGFSVLLATGFTVFLACLRDFGGGLLSYFSTLAPTLDGLLLDLAGAR